MGKQRAHRSGVYLHYDGRKDRVLVDNYRSTPSEPFDDLEPQLLRLVCMHKLWDLPVHLSKHLVICPRLQIVGHPRPWASLVNLPRHAHDNCSCVRSIVKDEPVLFSRTQQSFFYLQLFVDRALAQPEQVDHRSGHAQAALTA